MRSTSIIIALAALIASSAFALGGPQTTRTGSEPPGRTDTKPHDAPHVKSVSSKDGTSIAYEQSGKGPVLILVAGALSDRSSSARLASLLSPHFTVINYDRRGRGDSGDTQPYAVQREIEDIEALIDAVGGSAFLFGSSSGAALSLEAATRLPKKVTRAILYEPPFVTDETRPAVPKDFVQHLKDLVAAGRRGDAVEYFMIKGVGVPDDMVAQMRTMPMWPSLEKLAHTIPYDATIVGDTLFGKPLPEKRWASATMPVLVMDGGNSDTWIRNSAAALPKVLPNAKARTMDGQDHSAPFTAPEAFVPVLVEFLAGDQKAS